MTIRRALQVGFLVGLLGLLAACGDEGPSAGPGDQCPAALPTAGAACSAPASARCDYFKEKSRCNYLDLSWHCTCGGSGWACTDDKEDCPCPATVPASGSTCAFPGPSTCDYGGSAPRDGGFNGNGSTHCTCDGKSWHCVVYAG